MNLTETKRLLADFTPQPVAVWKETLGTGKLAEVA